MNEIWKEIKGYEGYYKISNFGNVKSLTRTYKDSIGRVVTKKGRDQKKYIRRNYWAVWLYKENKSTPFSIHRLVALHFVTNYDNKNYVNHINGNKLDNNYSNLEWCTAKENTNHAIKNNLIIFYPGENSRFVKLNEEQVFYILKSNLTQQELADKFNVSRSNISAIKRGKSWTEFAKTLRTEINKITESEVSNV
jgi:DNA-binding XRE family transcriptional regulator